MWALSQQFEYVSTKISVVTEERLFWNWRVASFTCELCSIPTYMHKYAVYLMIHYYMYM